MDSKFTYWDGPQRSPEWFQLRIGRISASRLKDWMAVSVAKGKEGTPLKARLDYETELMFERQFNVAYNNYTNDAMQDGIDFEGFAIKQYEKISGNFVDTCGCWYNDTFIASPDGRVKEDGLVEAKVLRDAKFTEVLINGVPDDHWKQIQGQLRSSGREWCDYVAINLGTKKVKIIRVLPDPEFHEWLDLILQEQLVVAKFDSKSLYDFVDDLPDWSQVGQDNPKLTKGNW